MPPNGLAGARTLQGCHAMLCCRAPEEGKAVMGQGYAVYDAARNRLEVVRPGESTTRYIPCLNFRPGAERVFGVQVSGDEIWLLAGPSGNPRPNRKYIYRFSSLTGGASKAL